MNKKWISIQPLIGGMDIGISKFLGQYPDIIITSGLSNDLVYIEYIKEVSPNTKIIYCKDDFILDNYDFGDIGLITATPFCKGLSILTKNNCGCANINMLNIARLVQKINPDLYIFENAYNLGTPKGEQILNNIKEIFNKYYINLTHINNIYIGVPQNRKRSWIICGKYKNIDLKINKNIKTLDEYFGDKYLNFEGIYDIKEIDGYNFIKKYNLNIKEKTFWQFLLKNKEWLNKFLEESDDKIKNRYIKKLEKINNGFNIWDNTLKFNNDFLDVIVERNIKQLKHYKYNRTYCIEELLDIMGIKIEYLKYIYSIFKNISNKQLIHLINQNVDSQLSFKIIEGYYNGVNNYNKFNYQKIIGKQK